MSRKEDLEKLKDMLTKTAHAMFWKLERKYDEGYTGWDDPEKLKNLKSEFYEHFSMKGIGDPDNIIDIMNLLAMIRKQILEGRGLKKKTEEKLKEVLRPTEKAKEKLEKAGLKLVYEGEDKSRATEDMKDTSAMIDFNRPEEEVEEALVEAGLKDPPVKDKEDTGIKFTKETYEPKERSFDITFLPDTHKGDAFFPFENYVYVDIKKNIHHIRFAEISFGVFIYQIISIDGDNADYYKFFGSREKLFIRLEDIIIKHVKLK